MQAVAAELSGYAGKFRCFLERRVEKQRPLTSCSCHDTSMQLLNAAADAEVLFAAALS